MKRIFTLAFLVLCVVSVTAQKRNNVLKVHDNISAYKLFVSFNNGVSLGNSTDYAKDLMAYIPEFQALSETYGITVHKTININPAKLEELERLAVKNTGSGKSVAKLPNIVELRIDNPTNERMLALGQALQKSDGVEYCSLMPAVASPFPYDIPPATPLLTNEQNYMTDYGVNMTYAWEQGLTGANMRIRDLEGNVNPEHEEFNERNVYHVDGLTVHPQYTDHTHGTGVFGVMYADPGDYGVTGLCYGAEEMVMYPVITLEEWYNVPYTLSHCLENSTEGDFIIYELQTPGANEEEGYCPIEYELPVWDLTKAATDSGMIVIAAAGNGDQNLDAPEYQEYMERGHSGAIIIGAGTPDELHNRLYFSTHGERVDLQGWGFDVLTAGTGTAYIFGEDDNQTYTLFSGTSSATPIVASCAVVLQSYYHEQTGGYLTGNELRDLLHISGVAQGTELFGNVGPFPNMPQAIAAMDELLGLNSIEKNTFMAYPNPVVDKLMLAGNFSGDAKAEVLTSLGQVVLGSTSANEAIDFSNLADGIYFVKVTDNGKSITKKVVKN